MLLTTVLLLFSLAHIASSKFHHGLSEDELNKYFGTSVPNKVPNYEIISPTPIRGNRFRREVSGGGREPLEFNLKGLGEDYHLQLHHNAHLIPTSCLTHIYRENGTKVVQPCASAEENCYYHGSSLAHNGSRAAISTCRGLHGIITTADHQLHIQPVRDEHKSRVRRSITNPHIVYRKTAMIAKIDDSADILRVQSGESLRRKRSHLGKKTIEMMVVTDKTMTELHGEDTKRYTLTAVNIAAQRFLKPDLADPIHLAVVKLILLEGENPDLDISHLNITQDAKQTLQSFCNWQEKINPKDDRDPQHADTSALITRLDIQIEGDNDNTGLSTLSGMCKPNERCSYNQDTGLELGLTIAHELGHTMGLVHDGEGNSCAKGNIMSPNGGNGSQAFQWSSCSVTKFKDFKKSKQSECLDDSPGMQLVKIQTNKPGLLYDANDQCRLAYGEGSTICEGTSLIEDGDECSKLVCYNPLALDDCTADTTPRMDGTRCGASKWCIRGKCEAYEISDVPNPVDGGWSAWDAEWTACSRTCGGGVKVQHRRCNNPRPLFGRECNGSDVKAELCNVNRCKTSGYKFKEEQCAATNGIPYNNKTYSWVPYEKHTDATQCQMYCKAERMVVMRRVQYQDGTQCTVNSTAAFYRCLGAKCREFGCDGILDSKAMFDKCGKCDGKGNTCKKISGKFKKGQKHQFVTFVTIPKDSTDITITKKKKVPTATLR